MHLKKGRQKFQEARYPTTVEVHYTSQSGVEQVKPAEVLGTGKAQEPRVCLVDPGNPNEVLKLGTRATHEKELLFKEGGYVPKRRRHVGVMEAELHDGGTQTHKQYEVLSMERLKPTPDTEAMVLSAMVGTIAMARFCIPSDLGRDNLGVREVPTRELGQVVFVDGGSWETPGHFQYPNKWRSQGLWASSPTSRTLRRTFFDLVQEHYCSIHLLLEALLTKASEILSKEDYEQLIRNAIEQGALTETPLGATGFAMPTTRMSSNHLPDEWKVVDMNIPCHPNWCTGVGVTRASQSNQ